MPDVQNSNIPEKQIPDELGDVFNDTDSFLAVAKIIQEHLTNKQDIRNIALERLDLSQAKKIIDLGCGFGFFTQGLNGKVHPDAEITGIDRHPKYKQLFLQSCAEAGLRGYFYSKGISFIESFNDCSFDLVICSYALYFFPEYIKQISRLLKKDGVFIVITHSFPHMKEFTSYIKKILHDKGIDFNKRLPYETLIKKFSNENGMELLSPWFHNITGTDIKSTFLFKYNDCESFEKYFRFKRSFFIPGEKSDEDSLANTIFEKVKNDMKKSGELRISKNDVIFTCKYL